MAVEHYCNMPTVQGYISGKMFSVLWDTGCNSVVVRRELVSDEQLTGKEQSCVLIDGTVRTFPLAAVYINTPYYTGNVTCICMDKPVYDIIVGNIVGARDAKDPEPDLFSSTGPG